MRRDFTVYQGRYLLQNNHSRTILLDENFECLFAEIKIRSKKWLLSGSHNLTRHSILWHLVVIAKALDDLGCII